MRTERPVTTSSPSGSLWVRKCLGSKGFAGFKATSDVPLEAARTIAVGSERWYSSEESEENPSSPISSSAYRLPSGCRNCVWRLRGTSPTER